MSPEMRLRQYEKLRDLCLPTIEHYHDDLLVHDRKHLLEELTDCPFLHWTRQCGTHIVALIPADEYPVEGIRVPYLFATADRDHILSNGQGAIVRYCIEQKPNMLCHYGDAKGRVLQIDDAKALVIWKEYERTVKREWAKPGYRSKYRPGILASA